MKILIKPNAFLDVESKMKAVSMGVSGDRMAIEIQSYLRIMGFPIGNFGPNRNGVDGKFGEATQAAWKAFQILAGKEQPKRNMDSTITGEMEQAVVAGSTIRSLAGTAFEKGVQMPIDQGSTRAEFVNAVYYSAIVDEQESKVPAAVITTQAILETGYGKFIAVDMNSGQFSYNLFGIKGTGLAGSVVAWTREENPETKIWEPVQTRFRAYHNFLESIKAHSQFFYDNIGRYGGAFRTRTAADFAKAIAKAGYATDSNYAGKLIYLMNYWGLA